MGSFLLPRLKSIKSLALDHDTGYEALENIILNNEVNKINHSGFKSLNTPGGIPSGPHDLFDFKQFIWLATSTVLILSSIKALLIN